MADFKKGLHIEEEKVMEKIRTIVSGIDKTLSKDEQIRDLYIKLGYLFVRDVNFFYGDEEEKEEIYYSDIDLEDLDSYDIICKSIAKIYRSCI